MDFFIWITVLSSLALLALVLILMLVNKSLVQKIRGENKVYTTFRSLLGAPDPEHNTLNNDMIQLVLRDFLIERTEPFGYSRKYYPPDDVVSRLKAIAGLLTPHTQSLKDLGYHSVEIFCQDAMLTVDDEGRPYLKSDRNHDYSTIAALGEVGLVLTRFPFKETMSEEIAADLRDCVIRLA
ncbi:MAG: hypothetical protein AAF683_00815 [Pseudomonadota bacterium]